MENLKVRNLANFRILAGMLIGAALAPAICAQAPPQLQVEVGANQQVRILASHVSYGEVLRSLRGKLAWEIEIPPLADELKISYVRVETTQPQDALAKLLEGSGLGYAFLDGMNKSRSVKVIVIPATPREPRLTQDAASTNSPIPDNGAAGASLPLPAPVQTVSATPPNATAVETMPEQPSAPSTMPLSEAINAIGGPPGMPLGDVGKTMTLPISEAARIMGVPPGMSPGDVGKTTTLPLPTGPGRHP